MMFKKRALLRSAFFLASQIFFIFTFLFLMCSCEDFPEDDQFLSPLDNNEKSWKFVVYGDTAANDVNHRAVLQAIMSNTPDYKFIINTGDVVANGDLLDDWQTWQKACDDILLGTGQNGIPPKYMAAPGNHDKVHTLQGLANWANFLSGQVEQFGNNGTFFYFDYNDARFVILDSNSFETYGLGPQYDILMEVIQNNPREWLFVFWHHPIFDFGPKEYRDDIHDTWGVPLYQNRCDIIFVGHAHFYVRTFKIELDGTINPSLDRHKGTVQIIAGNGGIGLSTLDPDKDGNGYLIASCQDKSHGYCEVTVAGDRVHLRHILSDGTIFDEKFYYKDEEIH